MLSLKRVSMPELRVIPAPFQHSQCHIMVPPIQEKHHHVLGIQGEMLIPCHSTCYSREGLEPCAMAGVRVLNSPMGFVSASA